MIKWSPCCFYLIDKNQKIGVFFFSCEKKDWNCGRALYYNFYSTMEPSISGFLFSLEKKNSKILKEPSVRWFFFPLEKKNSKTLKEPSISGVFLPLEKKNSKLLKEPSISGVFFFTQEKKTPLFNSGLLRVQGGSMKSEKKTPHPMENTLWFLQQEQKKLPKTKNSSFYSVKSIFIKNTPSPRLFWIAKRQPWIPDVLRFSYQNFNWIKLSKIILCLL